MMTVNSKKYSKIFYIHGYQSSPNSNKGALFKKSLNAFPIKYRDCPPEKLIISDCLKRIAEVLKDEQNVALIGSSLGGFLAASTALSNSNVKKLILLNPAIITPSTNLDEIDDLPRKIRVDMVDKKLFKKSIIADIFIIRGTNDNLIPEEWITTFAAAQEATVKYLHDDHRLSKHLKDLPEIISEFLK